MSKLFAQLDEYNFYNKILKIIFLIAIQEKDTQVLIGGA